MNPTIVLADRWSPNGRSILVKPESVTVRFETRSRQDESQLAPPHVALGLASKGEFDRFKDLEYELTDLREVTSANGTAYMWTVKNLKRFDGHDAHFTVAYFTPEQKKIPLCCFLPKEQNADDHGTGHDGGHAGAAAAVDLAPAPAREVQA